MHDLSTSKSYLFLLNSSKMSLHFWYAKCVLRISGFQHVGEFVEMQNFRPHLRWTELESTSFQQEPPVIFMHIVNK